MNDETDQAIPQAPTPPAFPGSRSISVGGNVQGGVLNAGDHNTISVDYKKADLPPAESVDIKAEIAALREALTKLESPDQSKVQNALADADSELAKSEPDKEEVGDAIDRALKYAKKAEDFGKAVEALKGPLTGIASWLGTNWDKILATVGLTR